MCLVLRLDLISPQHLVHDINYQFILDDDGCLLVDKGYGWTIRLVKRKVALSRRILYLAGDLFAAFGKGIKYNGEAMVAEPSFWTSLFLWF